MKPFLVGIALATFALGALADTRPVCVVQANHFYNMDNFTQTFLSEMTREECFEKGEALFNSKVISRTRIINVIKNKLIYKTQPTQYKTVRATYFPAGARPESETFRRDVVIKGPVTVKEIEIESGLKCWTKDECIPK